MTRWIRPWLATAAYDDRPDGSYFLSDVRYLVDKSGNSNTSILEAVERGVAEARKGQTIVVTCDFGISRSNCIAAGILSFIENTSLDAALESVMSMTGEREIKLDMIQNVRAALSPAIGDATKDAVLVTGGNGFLGRSLIPRLQQHRRVLAPSRDELDLADGATNFAAYCRAMGVGEIVHLAYPRVYTNNAAMAVGLSMLRSVAETCKLLDLRLTFVSSWVVFGGYAAEELWADEALPMRSKGVYSDAKYLEEMLIQRYIRRGDIACSICRLPPVYGPGGDRPRLIKTFYQNILAGHKVTTHRYRNGVPKLDLLYVDDAVEAVVRSVCGGSNSIFHFGSGALHSTIEIAKAIAEIANRPFIGEEVAIDDDIANIRMNWEKAAQGLDWAPCVQLRVGLENCLQVVTKAAREGK